MVDMENHPLIRALYCTGEFGRFQIFVYVMAVLAALISAPVYVDYNFISRRVDYRCYVPNCDDYDNPKYQTDFFNFTIPPGEKEGEWDKCNRYMSLDDPTTTTTMASKSGECMSNMFSINETLNCTSYVYDNELFQSTTVTEFDITCGKSWMGPLAGSMYMLGMLVGAITIGDIADRFGRKIGLLVSIVLLGGGGVLAAVSPNYYMFLAMRFICGAGGVGLFQVTFVLAVEFIGAKWRTFCGIMIEVPFALGEATVGVLAYFIREWRWLQVAVTAPAFLLISYMWLMPESVRWLISQNRHKDAVKVIERAAKFNKVDIPKHLLEEPEVKLSSVDISIPASESRADLVRDDPDPSAPRVTKKTVLDLLRTPCMRKRTINLFFCWAVCTLVYYGLSSNSGNLGGNIFVNFISTMLIEIPSYIFSYYALDRMGRKGTLSFVLLLGGTACFVSGFVPEDPSWVIVTLSLIGKFGIAAAFAIVYVYSAEIFPTDYRSVGVGACSMCARIGGILAPFVADLSDIYKPLPLLVFGSLSILSGALVIFLPETMGSELPQTLKQSEEFGKDQSIWYFSCCAPRSEENETERGTKSDN